MTASRVSKPRWLSTDDVAAELEVGPRLVYRLINQGKLTGYRIGRIYRVRRTDLDLFLARAELEPGDLDHLTGDVSDVV